MLFPGQPVCDSLCDNVSEIPWQGIPRNSHIAYGEFNLSLPAVWSSVMDMLEQFYCFRGGPSVIFSVTLFPGLGARRKGFL